MTIEAIETCVERFLATDEPEVLAISGKWGVGKTFFWNQLLRKKVKNDSQIKPDKYAYVSLFGINSLAQLKSSIFENTVSRADAGRPITIEDLTKNVKGLSSSLGRKSAHVIFNTKLLSGFAGAMEATTFLSVRNTLICIDDLERVGAGLSLKDVLGLISYLKENRNCRFVLLLNQDNIDDIEYKNYREKVIDTELVFVPTSKECAKIALGDDAFKGELVKRCIVELNVSNIRTIHKVKRFTELLKNPLTDVDDEIVDTVIRSVVFMVCCHYRAEKSHLPTLDFVRSLGNALFGIANKASKEPNASKWISTIRLYGYERIDELDKAIADGVVNGFFNEQLLRELITEKHNEIQNKRASEAFHNSWDLYHNTFADNQQEIIETMDSAFRLNAHTISPLNLDNTVSLFRDLDENKRASELIDFYIAHRATTPEIFDLQSNPFGSDVKDEEIRTRFAEQDSQVETKPSLCSVLDALSSKNSWYKEDEDVLAEATPEDYVATFERAPEDKLDSYIRVGLQFREWSDGGDKKERIGTNVEEALRIIGRKSKINEIRVLRKYGISIDDRSGED